MMPEEMSYICFILYYKDDGLHANILLAKVLEHSHQDGQLIELSQFLPGSSCADGIDHSTFSSWRNPEICACGVSSETSASQRNRLSGRNGIVCTKFGN